MRLYRWLCCLTGHHRETVETFYAGPGIIRLTCLDCPASRILLFGAVFTPSRRYALRRQRAA